MTRYAELMAVNSEGGVMNLGGMLMKHVILRNATVLYSGYEPMDLQDVIFVNCTFSLSNEQQARQFVDAVFVQPSVTFRV